MSHTRNLIAWLNVVGEGEGVHWRPLDIGVAVSTDAAGGFEMQGYGGWAVDHPEWPRFRDLYPQIAKVVDVLPARSLADSEKDMMQMLDRHIGDGDYLTIAHRTPRSVLELYLPSVTSRANAWFDVAGIEKVIDFMGISTEYRHNPEDEEYPERAVGRAVHHRAEVLVYGGNIQAWGNANLQEIVDEAVSP